MAVDYFNLGLKIGSVSGLISVIWLILKDVNRWYKQPRLKIEFDKSLDIKEYSFADRGWHRKFFNLRIFNKGRSTANRCVATLNIINKPREVKILEKNFILHWSDVDYSGRTNEPQPVDIGKEEHRRLDVVFTDRDINTSGSWIAIPMALSTPQKTGQAFLPKGEYIVEISINCENGRGDKKKFKIVSPEKWNDLKVSIIE
ncbi:MAG: hypothetical protein DRQ24_12590 [Candidatus Latescibacterota bacterium]|nr:MAG: hypothetical protein DRQ24_12590 [Candidatus Latescibacterota bacterium]